MALLDASKVSPLNPNTPEAENVIKPLTEAELTADGQDIRLGTGGYGEVLLKQYEGKACCMLSFPPTSLIVQLVAVKVPKSKAPSDIKTIWQREFDLIRELNHVNLVPLIGYYYPPNNNAPEQPSELPTA